VKVEFALHATAMVRARFGSGPATDSRVPEPYRSAHLHCFANREEIFSSKLCSCFGCMSPFTPTEIWEWHDDGLTAFCPECQMDTVIGDSTALILDLTFLTTMNELWLGYLTQKHPRLQ
jgi:hypothetical protein